MNSNQNLSRRNLYRERYVHPQGPAQLYLFIHGQILREADAFERAVKLMNRKDANQVAGISKHFAFIKQGLLVHEEGEEQIMFPALERQFQHVADSYVFDHEHQNMTVMDDIENTLTSLAKSPDSELQERLNRQSIALSIMLNLHVLKENELLVPIIYDKFSVEEQLDIMRRMSAHVPPEVGSQWLSRTFKALKISEREMLARTMKQLMPPEHFGRLASMFRNSVSPQEWQELVQRMPDLGGREAK